MDPLSLIDPALESLSGGYRLLTQILARDHKLRDDDIRADYDIVREKLDEIEKQIKAWKMLWKVDEGISSASYESLWSSRGRDEIQISLMRISRSARRMQKTIASQFEEWKDTKNNNKWKILQAYRGPQRLRTERMRLGELRIHLAELAEAVDSLVAMSQMRYLSTHQTPKKMIRRNGSTVSDSSRSGSTTNGNTSSLESILMTRTSSQELYRFCHRSLPLHTYLLMDLLEDQLDSMLSNSDAKPSQFQDNLQYHLFIRQPSSTMPSTEFILKRLEENDPNHSPNECAADNRPIESINELLAISGTPTDATSITNRVRVFSLYNSETRKNTYFDLRKPPTHLVLNEPPKSLAKFFTEGLDKPFYDSSRLLLDARYDLAFKIVQCGLYLLGTPWLSGLNSSSLLKATTSDKEDLYLLPVQISDAPAEIPWPQFLFGTDSQIFRIGTLLIEIALETPLQPVEPGSDISPFLSRMTRQAAAEMGPDYGEAVRYCLKQRRQSSKDDRDPDVGEVEEAEISDPFAHRLALFHKNVYSPIERSLHILHPTHSSD